MPVPGDVGNTQKDPQRFASLYEDVVTKLFGQLPDPTWVYPGHGTDTTPGVERPHLAEWRERGWETVWPAVVRLIQRQLSPAAWRGSPRPA